MITISNEKLRPLVSAELNKPQFWSLQAFKRTSLKSRTTHPLFIPYCTRTILDSVLNIRIAYSARCQNREGQSPLAIHTAVFVHVLVLLAAGFALCFGESVNLTWLDNMRIARPPTTPQLSSRCDSRATHARTLLPAELASVPFGFV